MLPGKFHILGVGAIAVFFLTAMRDAPAAPQNFDEQIQLNAQRMLEEGKRIFRFDDSFAPGIGKRLDGWANRDLNIGAIVATAPNLQPFSELLGVDVATVKSVLNSWGPGRYDAELNVDGKATLQDVVEHYDGFLNLHLSNAQQRDLIEYLKSI